jgi:hypothetical protein
MRVEILVDLFTPQSHELYFDLSNFTLLLIGFDLFSALEQRFTFVNCFAVNFHPLICSALSNTAFLLITREFFCSY